MDVGRVIKGLECHLKELSVGKTCFECPYCGDNPCEIQLIANAIALLKEKEAVTIKKIKDHGFGVYGGICPKCKNWIQSPHSYCGFCGQQVDWNE